NSRNGLEKSGKVSGGSSIQNKGIIWYCSEVWYRGHIWNVDKNTICTVFGQCVYHLRVNRCKHVWICNIIRYISCYIRIPGLIYSYTPGGGIPKNIIIPYPK